MRYGSGVGKCRYLKRAKEGCVLVWDRDSIRLEELLGTIQALRAQLIVSKTENIQL